MFDCFLKIESIPGESKDSKHKDEIELLSINWGAAQSGTSGYGGGAGAGRVTMEDVQVTKRFDKASPKIMLACCNGEHIGDKATWEFTALEPGWYEVLVTFPNEGNQASNAPYTVYGGATAKGTVTVDQRVDPSGAIFEGSRWESLGSFSITGDTLRVELSDNANGNIVADAVRIVPTGNDVQVLSLEKSLTSEDVTAQVSVTVQVP